VAQQVEQRRQELLAEYTAQRDAKRLVERYVFSSLLVVSAPAGKPYDSIAFKLLLQAGAGTTAATHAAAAG
jgi:hypothetical protein